MQVYDHVFEFYDSNFGRFGTNRIIKRGSNWCFMDGNGTSYWSNYEDHSDFAWVTINFVEFNLCFVFVFHCDSLSNRL